MLVTLAHFHQFSKPKQNPNNQSEFLTNNVGDLEGCVNGAADGLDVDGAE
jgi:hypothetical protein